MNTFKIDPVTNKTEEVKLCKNEELCNNDEDKTFK
jgi:hypothetical protein